MLYIITPDYTQACGRSAQRRATNEVGGFAAEGLMGLQLEGRRSYIHQTESDPSGNTFRYAIGIVFARVVLEPLEAYDTGFVVQDPAGLLPADAPQRADLRRGCSGGTEVFRTDSRRHFHVRLSPLRRSRLILQRD